MASALLDIVHISTTYRMFMLQQNAVWLCAVMLQVSTSRIDVPASHS